jgi:tRNA/tmRNA/rRNA uracil-C5-methylase (TrmA/RlmC/RlmD family)
VLDVGPPGHGGFCIARHEGRVVFVRHTLPGERVRALVTEGGTGDRYLRADAIEVLAPAAERVEPPCPYAGPGRCGGCDWQHVAVAHQRVLKAQVVAEQFRRVAGLDLPVTVEPLAGAADGLGWRTRAEFAVGADGRAGLRRHRSHEVVPLATCPICHPAVLAAGALGRQWPRGVRALHVAAPSVGEAVVVGMPGGAVPTVTERVRVTGWSGEFALSALGFWQGHPGAAAAFCERVLSDLAPRLGDAVVDLYAGAGLFTLPLAAAVGPLGAVLAVESDEGAAAHARENATAYEQVSVRCGLVEEVIGEVTRADLVALDPPRAGAGQAVMAAVTALGPRAVSYVSCDPATLARDVRYAADGGYRLDRLNAFDAFPMTHHVECIARLVPG